MSGTRNGIVAGAAIAGAGAVAHVTAGGAVGPGLAAATTAAMTIGAVAGPRLRWTFWRTLVAAALAQPFLHLTLASAGDPHAAHAGHAGHATLAAGGDDRMWILHTVVAVAVAVAVRWGGRWLRTMPGAARALAIALAPAGAPPLVATAGWTMPPAVAPLRSGVKTCRTSRGPPSPT